ncbi:MAG: tRNA (adenosine(37)-N6)-threonylcarbamoyltransferase complex ATPase subunit type 1 TsaE [Pseudomonadota bacterium]
MQESKQMCSQPIILASEKHTEQFGAFFAKNVKNPTVIFLDGDLGAGKTTFSRGFLRGLGYSGSVKSPTYTLVEGYPLEAFSVYHFDLYRIADPDELLFIGLDTFFTDTSICLVEWPEKGLGYLPVPNFTVKLCYTDAKRRVKIIAKESFDLEWLANWHTYSELFDD